MAAGAAAGEEGTHGGEEVEVGQGDGDDQDWDSQVVDGDETGQVPGLK